MYEKIISKGFYLEIHKSPLNCIDFDKYGNLLIIDPEKEFKPEEIKYIQKLIFFKKLNLIVFFEWFDIRIFKKMNKKSDLIPNNIFSLNRLLNLFGIKIGYESLTGSFSMFGQKVQYLSGSSINEFPAGNILVLQDLKSEFEIIYSHKSVFETPPRKYGIFGLYQNFTTGRSIGKIALFGDSTCLELEQGSCIHILDQILDFISDKILIDVLPFKIVENFISEQNLSNENEVFFLDYFKSNPIGNFSCRNFFFQDVEIEGFMNDFSIAENENINTVIFERIRQLFVIVFFLLAGIIFVVVYLRKQRRNRMILQNEVYEFRIPKYSVIYI